jgi:hypothetical protein
LPRLIQSLGFGRVKLRDVYDLGLSRPDAEFVIKCLQKAFKVVLHQRRNPELNDTHGCILCSYNGKPFVRLDQADEEPDILGIDMRGVSKALAGRRVFVPAAQLLTQP